MQQKQRFKASEVRTHLDPIFITRPQTVPRHVVRLIEVSRRGSLQGSCSGTWISGHETGESGSNRNPEYSGSGHPWAFGPCLGTAERFSCNSRQLRPAKVERDNGAPPFFGMILRSVARGRVLIRGTGYERVSGLEGFFISYAIVVPAQRTRQL